MYRQRAWKSGHGRNSPVGGLAAATPVTPIVVVTDEDGTREQGGCDRVRTNLLSSLLFCDPALRWNCEPRIMPPGAGVKVEKGSRKSPNSRQNRSISSESLMIRLVSWFCTPEAAYRESQLVHETCYPHKISPGGSRGITQTCRESKFRRPRITWSAANGLVKKVCLLV